MTKRIDTPKRCRWPKAMGSHHARSQLHDHVTTMNTFSVTVTNTLSDLARFPTPSALTLRLHSSFGHAVLPRYITVKSRNHHGITEDGVSRRDSFPNDYSSSPKIKLYGHVRSSRPQKHGHVDVLTKNTSIDSNHLKMKNLSFMV